MLPPLCTQLTRDSDLRVPVRSGTNFWVESPPENALVRFELAEELRRVLERFAREAIKRDGERVSVFFRPGIFGHHKVGRAVDIYAVGGVGLDDWKKRWDVELNRAARLTDDGLCKLILQTEGRRNLGWRLYKSLQMYGRWSRPCGYPVQLFGPWTRSEGPWKRISNFLLNAHRDHIHVAK